VANLNLLVQDAGKAALAGLEYCNGCMQMQPFFIFAAVFE